MKQSKSWIKFIKNLDKLKVDRSFYQENFASNHRMAKAIVELLRDKKFTTRKCAGGHRVYRIS